MEHSLSSSPTPSSGKERQFRTMLEFALLYAREGRRILPLHALRSPDCCTCGREECRSIAKHPITQQGVKDATSDVDQIREWWRLYPYANIGIATGRGMLVVDLDPRHGGTLDALQQLVDLPPTAMVRTGSGGLHLYFSYDEKLLIGNTAAKLGPGIDTRGENGYVVAPPSIHTSGNRYLWDRHKGYLQAPEALMQLLFRKNPPQKSTPQGAGQAAIPDMIPEGRRNTTLVSLAGSLRNLGANEEALFIVLQAMNQASCRPPLAEDEVRTISHTAAKWTPGMKAMRPDGLAAVQSVAALLKQDIPEPQWCVPGFLPEGVTLLAGKPKMGKSWLGLGLALAVASGTTALGRLPTIQGHVLYLGLEDNQRRICDRVRKMLQGADLSGGLSWAGQWSPLASGGLDDLETWIKAKENTRLVIIDTLACVRSTTGNAGGNMYAEDYAAIQPLKQLAERYHVSILLIHHLRKGAASDPMDEISGSTGLTGATDCNMVLQRERGKSEAILHVTGRDVEEQTLALTFHEETAHWSLNTALRSANLSPDRQAIIDLLAASDQPMSPGDIASALSMEVEKVRKRLSHMCKTGLISNTSRGLYQNVAPTAVQFPLKQLDTFYE